MSVPTKPQQDDLLAVCKELRYALAGAMQVLVNYKQAGFEFHDKMKTLGIRPGIGVRADEAIKRAERGEA